ncbi:MAG: alpha/beta fold hydrolase [Acidobacteriota bacterium]|jgi:predicted alpha/beta-hydrolase family hydrolase|nr:alpha/beta fold hydrolase [Acidobacteriota bacterium]
MSDFPPIESCNEPFLDPPVRGHIHRPENSNNDGIIFTHGAGSSSNSPLLVALANAFAGAGFTVLRCDLPFRQKRAFGPPRPGDAAHDREGLKRAIEALRSRTSGRIFLGGHSYGGRQATMLCASEPGLVDGLLLFSYPLHPPRKPEQLRTQHFPGLKTPAVFVHGTRDPFGSIGEMKATIKLIPAKTLLMPVEGAGHDLGFKGKVRSESVNTNVLETFRAFFFQNK